MSTHHVTLAPRGACLTGYARCIGWRSSAALERATFRCMACALRRAAEQRKTGAAK